MNSISFFKSVSVLLVFLVIAVGGICSSFVQANSHAEHCADGGASSWCGNIADHKTLMSIALVSVMSLLSLGAVVLAWIAAPVSSIFIRRYRTIESFVRRRLFLLIPNVLQTLFSRGILNPQPY